MAAGTVAIPSKRFDELAQRLVASGRYNSPSEVLEAALDALEREECDEEAKEAWLEQALEAGFASGVAEGDVFARVREQIGLKADCSCSGLNGDCPVCGDGILRDAARNASEKREYEASKTFKVKKKPMPKTNFDEVIFEQAIERDAPAKPVANYPINSGPTPTKRKTKICPLCDPPKPITLRRFVRHQAEVHGHHATRVSRMS
jgi:putative addiction module CopG family antidote